ncbi:MAG: hypothetical protein ABIR24_10460, partial [Verrucomicrobiota bacterium]
MKNFTANNTARQGNSFSPLLALFLLVSFVSHSIAADISWTNTTGGNWSVAANWNPNAVPASTDNVFITNSGTYTVTFDIIGNGSVSNLTLGGVTGTQVLSNDVMYLTIFGSGNINSNGVLTYSGGNVAGRKSINSGGKIVWNGGDMNGALTIAPNGLLEVTNGGTKRLLAAGSINNFGRVVWSGGPFSFQAPAPFYNESGGRLEIQCDGQTMSSSYFFNRGGVFLKTVGSGTSTIRMNFDNNDGFITNASTGVLLFSDGGNMKGIIAAESGTIIFRAVLSGQSFTLDGAFYAAAGGTNLFQGKFTFNNGEQNFTGPGVNDFGFGNADFNVPITNLTLNGVLIGTNELRGTMNLTNLGGINGVLT